jgi:hypothetical protein
MTFHMPDNSTVARDLKERFPRVYCPTCEKTQPMIFDVMEANEKNDHDVADILCDECKSIIATLHAPRVRRPGVRTAPEEFGDVDRLHSTEPGSHASSHRQIGARAFAESVMSILCRTIARRANAEFARASSAQPRQGRHRRSPASQHAPAVPLVIWRMSAKIT